MTAHALKHDTSFLGIINTLNNFWQQQGCTLVMPYESRVGAGTFHPDTLLKSLGPDPWKCAYVQSCSRPTDGRYGRSGNRLQSYFQYQVFLKPAPRDSRALYLESIKTLGINPLHHHIQFLEDNWESPTLGASGLGWEIRCNGTEITQFTYFQKTAEHDCDPIATEITYGLERLALYLQKKQDVFELEYSPALHGQRAVTYGSLFQEREEQFSHYNFKSENNVCDETIRYWFNELVRSLAENRNIMYPPGVHINDDKFWDDDIFEDPIWDNRKESEISTFSRKGKAPLFRDQTLPSHHFILPAYDLCLKASHAFNVLDARRCIPPEKRPYWIGKIRQAVRRCADTYLKFLESKKSSDTPSSSTNSSISF